MNSGIVNGAAGINNKLYFLHKAEELLETVGTIRNNIPDTQLVNYLVNLAEIADLYARGFVYAFGCSPEARELVSKGSVVSITEYINAAFEAYVSVSAADTIWQWVKVKGDNSLATGMSVYKTVDNFEDLVFSYVNQIRDIWASYSRELVEAEERKRRKVEVKEERLEAIG